MKHVTIIVPKGDVVLSSITGSLEILTRANDYWQKLGKSSAMKIHIASFEKELLLDDGFFSVNASHPHDIEQTDLLIIPSLGHDYDNILDHNRPLIEWIAEQYKRGAEIASICTGAFLLARAEAAW